MLYLHSHFGNISSDHQTTSIGYQCNNITLIQSYQDCTWLIFPKLPIQTNGKRVRFTYECTLSNITSLI